MSHLHRPVKTYISVFLYHNFCFFCLRTKVSIISVPNVSGNDYLFDSFPIKIDFLQPKQIKTGTIIMKYLFFVLCGSKQKTIFVPIFVYHHEEKHVNRIHIVPTIIPTG